jgi:hypothetical protein
METHFQSLSASALYSDSLVTLIMEFDEPEDGGKREEQEHRVEQDESRDA